MMIEPPGDGRRSRILKIDNGILIAGKFPLVKQGSGAVDQSAEFIIRARSDAFAMEAREQRGRTGSIETFIVIKNTYFHLRVITPFATVGWQRYSNRLKQLGLLAFGDVSSERPSQRSEFDALQSDGSGTKSWSLWVVDLRDQLDLIQVGPQLSCHIQAVMLAVIGNSIQHRIIVLLHRRRAQA